MNQPEPYGSGTGGGRKATRAYLGIAAAMGMLGGWDSMVPEPKPTPTKPCLFCGKPHSHNNSFCSAECCKAWKERERATKKGRT
jgi:hypothetical protein